MNENELQHNVVLSNNKIGNHNIFVALVPILILPAGLGTLVLLIGMIAFWATNPKGFAAFTTSLFQWTWYAVAGLVVVILAALAIKLVLEPMVKQVIAPFVDLFRKNRVLQLNDHFAMHVGEDIVVTAHREDKYVHNYRYADGQLDEPEPLQIAGPVPTFAELLATRQIVPHEQLSILGYSDGQPRMGQWAKLHSFMVLGISGSGKSSSVAYYMALAVLHGARLLIIDPDAEEDESLTKRLAGLSFAFLCPPGTDAKSAARVLAVAEQEVSEPGDYPVVLAIDEVSRIMREGEKGYGEWAESADRITSTVESWAQSGRKRKRTVIAIGQIGKASRTGGTEVRASMTATFVHRLPAQQARLVLDNEEAKLCPTLETGEVMVLLQNRATAYQMHIPYTTPEDMEQVAHMMAGSDSNPTRTDLEPVLELSWQAKVDRIRQLRRAGRNQGQIIYQVYGLSKGGSADYAKAREEYFQIIAALNAKQQEQEV